MPKRMLISLVALLALQFAFADQRVTVNQLSGMIASFSKEKDAKVAGRLYGMELTQRLSTRKLAALEAELPGPNSRQALAALADQAEFLDLPPGSIPSQPAPTVDQERAIIAKSIDFAEATLHQLPNLFAQRDTIQFEDTPPALQATGNSQSGNLSAYEPMHQVSQSAVTVLYRKGREVVQNGTKQQTGPATAPKGMITYGEFGPILSVLYGDLPKGNLRWGHWEQGATGLDAVFLFNVLKADSHYLVRFCCVSGTVFQQFPAYHGELTIDPSKGTILRVTLIADMTRNDPITQSELLVKYAPVELGGKKYFCPVKSISVSRAPIQEVQRVQSAPLSNGITFDHIRGELTDAPLQTMLNETSFDQYHLFRGEVKVLTNSNAENSSAENAPADSSPDSSNQPK